MKVDGIQYLYMYQGGNDGSAGDKNWALSSVENIYHLLLDKEAGSKGHRYIYWDEGEHNTIAPAQFMGDCLRFLYPEFVEFKMEAQSE